MAVTLKEIAKKVGVSQMTVSRVLNGKSHGQVSPELAEKIKVALAESRYTSNQSARNLRAAKVLAEPEKKESVITLLLPSPYFLDGPIDFIAEYVEISNAVLQTASKYDAKVKMLPISRTNNRNEIEWSWLKELGAGSKVIAYSAWFLPALTELSRRGCRISMISTEVFWRSAYESIVKDWALFTYMTVDGASQLVQHLLEHGYQRPAIATKYADEPDEPLVTGYEKVMSKRKLFFRNIIHLPYSDGSSMESDINAIQAAYKQDPFDSLILACPLSWKFNYQISLQENLGLPEHVRIMFLEDHSDCGRLVPNISSIRYPRKQIGNDAAEALLAEHFVPGEKFYRGELIIR